MPPGVLTSDDGALQSNRFGVANVSLILSTPSNKSSPARGVATDDKSVATPGPPPLLVVTRPVKDDTCDDVLEKSESFRFFGCNGMLLDDGVSQGTRPNFLTMSSSS